MTPDQIETIKIKQEVRNRLKIARTDFFRHQLCLVSILLHALVTPADRLIILMCYCFHKDHHAIQIAFEYSGEYSNVKNMWSYPDVVQTSVLSKLINAARELRW